MKIKACIRAAVLQEDPVGNQTCLASLLTFFDLVGIDKDSIYLKLIRNLPEFTLLGLQWILTVTSVGCS